MADQPRNQESERDRERDAPANADETRGIYDDGDGRVEVFEHDEEDPDNAMSQEIGGDLDEDEQTSSER
jgi:hypothetical protein